MALTEPQIEKVVFFALLAVMVVLALFASTWRRPENIHSLHEWGIGGRAFGNWVTWFLIGGSSYTAYTLVAVPAYVWGVGAMGFYTIPLALLAVPLYFMVSTRIWSVSHVHGFVTSSEFVRARFGSRPLALAVALVTIAATLPYISIQLAALGAVFKTVGLVGEWPLLAALAVISAATWRGGLRAPALLSVAKDVLLVWLVLAVVLVVAMSGGWGPAFDAAQRRFAADPSPASDLLLTQPSQWTYISLAVGTVLGIFVYPHIYTSTLSSKDRNTIKRNAAAVPIYTMLLGLVTMLGIFAIYRNVWPADVNLAQGRVGDTSTIVPMVFHNLFPAWSAGLAHATLAVAALIPTAVMSIAAANIFTRSIYVQYFRPNATPAEETRVSRWASLLMKVGAAGAILWLDPAFSVEFQLIGGVIIVQVVPAVILGALTGWFHRWAVMLGLATGLAASLVMLYLTPEINPITGAIRKAHFGGSTWPLSKFGLDVKVSIYIGLIALIANLLVAAVVTLVLKAFHVSPNLDYTRPGDYTADADAEGIYRLDHLLDSAPARAGAHAIR